MTLSYHMTPRYDTVSGRIERYGLHSATAEYGSVPGFEAPQPEVSTANLQISFLQCLHMTLSYHMTPRYDIVSGRIKRYGLHGAADRDRQATLPSNDYSDWPARLLMSVIFKRS